MSFKHINDCKYTCASCSYETNNSSNMKTHIYSYKCDL